VPIFHYKGTFDASQTYYPGDIVVGTAEDGYTGSEVLQCLVQTIAGINILHTVDNAYIGSPPDAAFTQYFEILPNNPLDPSLDSRWVTKKTDLS
jgi:hypothetical protein